MPIDADDIRVNLCCGPDPALGRWRGFFDIWVAPEPLRRLGLHPDQPTARIVGPSPPAWWHAEAERTWHRRPDAAAEPRPRRRWRLG
ncbi:hypothetical protein [Dactylosporangium sp. CS-033363]|uniref:hypothetical protein n=1 Tax=Dactylosporangium sp. CS-033363 TaxID=3239935 RepID=UPI003D8BF5A3